MSMASAMEESEILEPEAVIAPQDKATMKYLSNVSVGRMRGNRVMWMEELDEQGTPIFIAEAATKTKISVRYEEREKKSKKIGC